MKKKLLVILALVTVIVCTTVGGTYAWFYAQAVIKTNGNAAKIQFWECQRDIMDFGQVLPGETVTTGKNIFWYRGNRAVILQFTLAGTATLPAGAENHTDWAALSAAARAESYQLNPDGVRYDYTPKRLNEVALLLYNTIYEDMGLFKVYQSTREPNTYYVYVPKELANGIFNIAAMFDLKITGELGGSHSGSGSRQFEQQTAFDNMGLMVTAIQVTQEAIGDVLGENALLDVQDMVANKYFIPPAEWDYVG